MNRTHPNGAPCEGIMEIMRCNSKRNLILAGVVTLMCALAAPAECDINRDLRTPELNSKLNELANDNGIYLPALWPSGGELTRYGVSLSVVPPTVVEGAASWIRRVIKDKWLPTEIDKQLIAMKDWKRRERRVTPDYVAFGVTVDALIAEFSRGGYNFQIQDDGKSLGVLIFPVKPNRAAPSIEKYITGSISKFLNVPRAKLGSLEYTLRNSRIGENKKIHYGHVWCEWNEQKHSSFEASKSQTWWNRISVCTDGNFIFLSMLEDLPNPNLRPTARNYTTEHHPRF